MLFTDLQVKTFFANIILYLLLARAGFIFYRLSYLIFFNFSIIETKFIFIYRYVTIERISGQSLLNSQTIVISQFIMMKLFKTQPVDALYRLHQKLDAFALGCRSVDVEPCLKLCYNIKPSLQKFG